MVPLDETFYQDFMSQNLPSSKLSCQINSDIEFKQKAIKQLHLWSLCLGNTEQYAKLKEKLSMNGGNISMSYLERLQADLKSKEEIPYEFFIIQYKRMDI